MSKIIPTLPTPKIILPHVYLVDLFCGAGGTSSGAHFAGVNVVACVNHDRNALKSHKKNHPDAVHLEEDVRDQEVVKKLNKIIEEIRRKDPLAIIILWASLECTNFSNAKGGMPRDADSRSLANSMFPYIDELDPDLFLVENVREFLAWGPLDENGKPISRTQGASFIRWYNRIKKYGYDAEYRILNSADFGAYQTRRRLFIQFSKKGINWPGPTHTKSDKKTLFSSHLPKWKPVKDVLDLEDRGTSIITRKKSLVEASLKRLYAGMVKFVAGGEDIFITKNFSGDPKDKSHSINDLCGTVTTVPKSKIVNAEFIVNPQYKCKGHSVEKPCCTLIARMDKAPLSLLSVNIQEAPKRFPIFLRVVGQLEHGSVLSRKKYFSGLVFIQLKINLFMNAFGISDIKIRMLKIVELLQIQGFPKDYKLVGNQTEQKKFIGNAVEVNNAKALIKAVCHGLPRYEVAV